MGRSLFAPNAPRRRDCLSPASKRRLFRLSSLTPASASMEYSLRGIHAPEKCVVSEGFGGRRFDWRHAGKPGFGSLEGHCLRTVCLGR